jgi:hypothetical protein
MAVEGLKRGILRVGAVKISGGLREVAEVILGEAVVEGDVNGVVGWKSLQNLSYWPR